MCCGDQERMKLPRLYTERAGLYTFWRGVRLTGDGPPHNMGAVGVVNEADARRKYLFKLRIAANRHRHQRLKAARALPLAVL